MNINLAAIGECLIELSQIEGNQYALNFAGDTFNTSYYLAKDNPELKVYYVTAVGDCPYSEQMRHYFQEQQIYTDYVKTLANKQVGLYLIQCDEQGEREFFYYRQHSAAKCLHQSLTHECLARLSQFHYLYTSGISLAILPDEGRQLISQLLRQIKANGNVTFFDNNYRPALWDNTESTRAAFEAIYPDVDVLFVTFDDERKLFGDTSIEETIARYQQYPMVTIIKDGHKPSYYVQQQQVLSFTTPKVDNVIDTTGAGDAFNAGFIRAYIEQKPLEDCFKAGQSLAGKVIGHKGAII